MKKFLFIPLILLMAFSCQQPKEEISEISIIPKPMEMETQPGFFKIDGKTQIIRPKHAESLAVAGFLKEILEESTGMEIPFGDFTAHENVIRFEYAAKEELEAEGYELEVTTDQIIIRANEDAGLFYGVQTLLQLLPPDVYGNPDQTIDWKVPCCAITDKPRFSWRGMHLDVSRHFFTVEFVKKYIDLIAMHKMNVFHWHLTDDNGWRIEIKKYPKLTEVAAWRVDREDMPWREVSPPEPGEKATYGGFYTQDEIREVIAYAAERYVQVVPEIEMPGHTSEIFAAYPELSCRGEKLYVQPGSYWPNIDIFCAGKEETFEFIENVLLEVMELFPSEYVHIGGDEADKTRWKECRLCQKRIKEKGLKDEHELQSWFVKRVEKFLNVHGKKLIGWDEILEGGLAPEATVMSWRGFQGGIDAATLGHDVVMCPTSYCYFDYYQADPEFEPEAIGGLITLKKVYSFEPIPLELSAHQAKHILGAQGNVWTEYISTPQHAEYMAVPRMTALAEVVWSSKETRAWDDFLTRLQLQFERFDKMNVNYSSGSWKVDIQPDWDGGIYQIKLESERLNPEIHYTLDGSEPRPGKNIYSAPIRIDSSVVIKAAIFVDGELKEKISRKEIIYHKCIGGQGHLKVDPDRKYFANGAASLTDGLKGSNNFRDGYWLGFQGEDMDFELELTQPVAINSISCSFYQQTSAWIFMPKQLIFEVLDDNGNILASVVKYPQTQEKDGGPVIEKINAEFENIKGSLIRVKAENIHQLPKWHESSGYEAWIFVDEIIVE
jgi:hexosaminidase